MYKYPLAAVIFLLTGCSFAPPYQRPPMPLPEHFKEMGTWIKVKKPPQIVAPNYWWQGFHDPILNQLEQELLVANQDLKKAWAHYQEATALVQIARADFFPSLQALFNADRQQNSTTIANPPRKSLYNQFLTGGFLDYEVDAWGSVRNTVIAANRLATASAADIAAIHLSLQTELAKNYFLLRSVDEQIRIMQQTIRAYQKALHITRHRYRGGASPIADVDEATMQLNNAQTLAIDLRLKRAELEHAIAALIGKIPSCFTLAPQKNPTRVLAIEPNLPSTLLERRPDILAAELRVQAANANIGVARAAFFPQFNLTGAAGFQSQALSQLISQPSLFWSLGPFSVLSLTQPVAQVTVFDGGRLRGLLNRAKADYYSTVATYRQTVITAFQQVEDQLSALKQLKQEEYTQRAATQAAVKAWRQERYRYEGGLVTFLQVVVVENSALQAELALVQLHARQQIASVQLIKALGGGWSLNATQDQARHARSL